MNWAAIGAIGEVLGAVAVVATLLYVARQLDEQSRALTTSVRDSAFQQLQEWNYQVMADPLLSHLFQRGAANDDWSVFSPEERSRLIHVQYSFFKGWTAAVALAVRAGLTRRYGKKAEAPMYVAAGGFIAGSALVGFGAGAWKAR